MVLKKNSDSLVAKLSLIRSQEAGWFLCVFLIFFLISVVYNLLRPLKISLIVSAPHSGAEIIPFIKVWGVLPAALLFSYLFTVFNRYWNSRVVINVFFMIFIVFFLSFMWILFPFRHFFELDTSYLEQLVPAGIHGLIAMVRYWHFSLFYIFAETWASVILSMLFWGFINETTSLKKAKRYYGFFAFGANIASVVAGHLGLILSEIDYLPQLPIGETAWDQSVAFIVGIATLASMAAFYLFNLLTRNFSLESSKLQQQPKVSFSLRQCFWEIIHNPYLRYLTLIVLGYNLVFNLTDVVWTNQLRLFFQGDTAEFNSFVSKVTIAKGLLATIIAVFFAGFSLNKLGWKWTAYFTPIIVISSSLCFFPLVIGDSLGISPWLNQVFSPYGVLYVTVVIGAFQNCMTRACKYTIFDATKEIAYIPLSKVDQRKGKAVIDGIGSRFGKSAGSVSIQILLLSFTTLSATIPYLGIFLLIIGLMWMYSIHRLDGEMKKRAYQTDSTD